MAPSKSSRSCYSAMTVVYPSPPVRLCRRSGLARTHSEVTGLLRDGESSWCENKANLRRLTVHRYGSRRLRSPIEQPVQGPSVSPLHYVLLSIGATFCTSTRQLEASPRLALLCEDPSLVDLGSAMCCWPKRKCTRNGSPGDDWVMQALFISRSHQRMGQWRLWHPGQVISVITGVSETILTW